MYSALELFISGTLKDYRSFVNAHPEFVSDKLKVIARSGFPGLQRYGRIIESLQVDEAVLLKKIRLLTLMSIAENNNVSSLNTPFPRQTVRSPY